MNAISRVEGLSLRLDQNLLINLIVQSQLNKNDDDIRRIVEILFDKKDFLQASKWLVFHTDLSCFSAEQLLQLRRILPRPFLNIGGGGAFSYPMWESLDSEAGALNPKPFEFGPGVRLPFKAGSFDLVYTSQAFGNLSDPTVTTFLSEARRVLRPGGTLLIKIPDFDAVLEAWNGDRSDYFRDELWGFASITPTFQIRGMKDSILTRAAYLFCGFTAGEYNGPAPMPESELIALMRTGSPHKIASFMTRYVMETERDFTFNHQNAWGGSELSDVINDAGFELISVNKRKIVERFNYIPSISKALEMNAFFLGSPKK